MVKRKHPRTCPECKQELPLAAGDEFEVEYFDEPFLEVKCVTLDPLNNLPSEIRNYVLREIPWAIELLVEQLHEEGRLCYEHKEASSEDVKSILGIFEYSVRARMAPRGRGGDMRLWWTDDRKLQFLGIYEAAQRRLGAMIERCREQDSFEVRLATLRGANEALPENEKLPPNIIEKVAARPGQTAAPSAAELAEEIAALEFGVDVNTYLRTVLTKARKLREHQFALPKTLSAVR
jgi:hypothetical protein